MSTTCECGNCKGPDLTEEQVKDGCLKLVELGQKAGYTPEEWAMIMHICSTILAERLNMEIKTVKKSEIPDISDLKPKPNQSRQDMH